MLTIGYMYQPQYVNKYFIESLVMQYNYVGF